MQIRALMPKQLFGLFQGEDVTTSLSNGLTESVTKAHTVCHVYILRYKAHHGVSAITTVVRTRKNRIDSRGPAFPLGQ